VTHEGEGEPLPIEAIGAELAECKEALRRSKNKDARLYLQVALAALRYEMADRCCATCSNEHLTTARVLRGFAERRENEWQLSVN